MEEAAIRIQAGGRGFLARVRVRHIRDAPQRERAAVRIQALGRGRMTRVKLAKEAEARRRDGAARQIQRVQRGREARAAVRKRKERRREVVVHVQAVERGRKVRGEEAERAEAAQKIQAVQRGRKGRQRAAQRAAQQRQREEAATRIQVRWCVTGGHWRSLEGQKRSAATCAGSCPAAPQPPPRAVPPLTSPTPPSRSDGDYNKRRTHWAVPIPPSLTTHTRPSPPPHLPGVRRRWSAAGRVASPCSKANGRWPPRRESRRAAAA